ncbi:MAG: UMP kinase [Phycisphaeraceae bacterium]|nr:UMP kinase [Phycisphaerales bacterium]MCB9860959.1 UMP kinase [Phycisphaeraceae bacterium]
MDRPKFTRVLLKLSGESLCKPGGHGVNPEELRTIAQEVESAHKTGVQIAIVIGGGNMIRGADLAQAGLIQRSTADYMGMLGTVMNGLALREALQSLGAECRVMSALEIKSVAEPFIRGRAIRHLEKGRVVVLVAGTGNPYFSTDTCAALRAAELNCECILKATKVDGVYSADPNKDPSAQRFSTLTFAEAIERDLKVMDTAAFAMCRDNRIPIMVFNFKESGNIARAVASEPIGTLVSM